MVATYRRVAVGNIVGKGWGDDVVEEWFPDQQRARTRRNDPINTPSLWHLVDPQGNAAYCGEPLPDEGPLQGRPLGLRCHKCLRLKPE